MKIFYTLTIVCLSFIGNAQSADEILDKYFQVNGGRESMGQKFDNTKEVYEINLIERKMIATQFVFKNRFNKEKTIYEWNSGEKDTVKIRSVKIFNGKKGCDFMFKGNNLAYVKDWDENKNLRKQKGRSSLLDACRSVKESGDSATYEGVEEFNNKKCYKIKYVKSYQNYDSTSDDQNLEYHFFDILTSLEVGIKNFDKKGVETSSIIEDFSVINGLTIPKRILLKKSDNVYGIVTLKEFKSDVILPEKEFEKEYYTR
ncbi:MAG: hypothetical protein QE277_00645 [Flectobacillus sp.]|nr:hypothetical protein [Flectobacillus sp.]